MEYVDIRSILICSIITSDEKNYKYFIGYEDNDYKVKPLCIRLQRTSANVKDYDGETKLMSFFIKDDDLLKTYNDTRNKVSTSNRKELDCEPINNKIFEKARLCLTVTRLQIFIAEKYQKQALNIFIGQKY